MIRISNLHKFYGTKENRAEVLKGINLEIEDGKIICVLGPSGSGKSTLLNILGGIETIDEGDVNVFGEDIKNMSKKALENYRRENLGFVFQFYNLISDLNVLENVEVGKYLSKKPLNTDTLLDELGLSEHKYKYPNEISGGQAQRASIARAMIKSPKLLICDEPTGALDYESAKDVLCLIENLNHKYHSTVIIASHNTQIAKMSDVILSLHNGSIKSVVENKDKISAKEVTW
ncbi:MAG: ABC transporter ATP-binding protein [Ezakiella sp.]|uniref:ABC transporter ATP-binding protein n=1 Tax=Ezakiella sp. TaxID=1935205 RepID=UPI002978A427|nr:ABC transporter ATP-binding protein [Ezakiella sp.]MDD7731215.1 ABC transporter ATP-binding protein [Eubacteriales bacterium]MDY6079809.1 ABC transporter ATP-binding protein [Ezakiella sp.]